MDKKWLIKRAALFVLSLGGIAIAVSVPEDPHGVISETTNMISEPPINPFPYAVSGLAITEPYGDNIRIGSDITGLIEEVYTPVNSCIEKGQPLFTIDTREIRAKIEVDKQDIMVKKRQLELLTIQYKRFLSVQDPRAISRETLSTKLSEINVARAELERAISALRADQVRLDKHTIRAPAKGKVLRSTIHKGELFGNGSGGSPTGSQTVVSNVPFEIVVGDDSDYLQLRLDVDEQNASRVHPDKPAIAYPRGVVRQIIPLEFVRIEPFILPKKSLTGEIDVRVDTRVLQVIYRFRPPKELPVYIGQRLDVYIQTDPLTLPTEAHS